MAKRAFDIVVALGLLALFSPLFLIIALALKITHPEIPLVIGVVALGKDRKIFNEWKFSTMISDAHNRLEQVLASDPALRKEWQETHKLKADPRILPGIGRFLRRTSLNELPQLINVLIGEMSLVGPRAITPAEEALYFRQADPETAELRFSVRPGITGLWQVERKDEVSYAERVALDCQYIKERNLFLDIRIMLKTAVKIVYPAGAY